MDFKQLLNKKQVTVTGANGFIGRAVVDALLAAGAHVTVILRSKHGAERLKGQGVTVHLGALDDPQTLRTALGGADVLYNLAYDMRGSMEANLAVFDGLLQGAKVAGVKRIVHASSIVVYDDWPHADLTENSAISTQTGGAYRQAKMTMERRLEACGIPTAIMQPTIVYGPRSTFWTVDILDQLARAPVVLPDCPSICNAVYVDDLAQAFLGASTLENLACERFIVSGAERLSWADFYEGYQSLVPGSEIIREPLEALQDRLGPAPTDQEVASGPGLAAKVSMRLRSIVGHDAFDKAVRTVKGLKAGKAPIYPGRSQLQLFSGTGVCSIAHAKQRIGYAPQFDFQRGLKEIERS